MNEMLCLCQGAAEGSCTEARTWMHLHYPWASPKMAEQRGSTFLPGQLEMTLGLPGAQKVLKLMNLREAGRSR